METDPVTVPDLTCGAEVVPHASAVTWDDADERYYFCSPDCRRAFVSSRHGAALTADSA